MTAKKNPRRGRRSGTGGDDASSGRTGLLVTIWAAVALVLVTGMYRAGRGELSPGHWISIAVVLLMGIVVSVVVTRDPG